MLATQCFDTMFWLTICTNVWFLFITKGRYVVWLVGEVHKYVIVKSGSLNVATLSVDSY